MKLDDNATTPRILIVEDDERVAKALNVRLRASGFEIFSVSDSITALSAAKRHRPDLIILDINLPGGDGFTFAERAQKIADIAYIPFIVITASKKPGLRERARELGAAGFLEKPYDARDLVCMVDSSIGCHA